MREPSVNIKMVVEPVATSQVNGQDIGAAAIISDYGPILPTLFSRSSDLIKAFTQTGKLLRSSDTTLIHAAALVDILPMYVCRAFDDDGARYGKAVMSDGSHSDQNVVLKNDNILEWMMEISYTAKPDYENLALQVGTKVYYIGSLPDFGEVEGLEAVKIDEVAELSDDKLANFIHAINKVDLTHHLDYQGFTQDDSSFKATIILYAINEGELGITAVETPGEGGTCNVYEQDYYTYNWEARKTFMTGKELFYVFSNNPGKNNLSLNLSYPDNIEESSRKENQLIAIDVTSNTKTYSYEGSLLEDYINEYNVNQFIENINEYDGIEFMIKVADSHTGDYQEVTGVSFGGRNVLSDKSLATRKAAIDKLCDDDQVKISFLLPCGYSSPAFGEYLRDKGAEIFAFVPYGIICDKNDPDVQMSYRPTPSGAYNIICMAPHDKNTGICDFTVNLSAEVKYMETVMNNAAKGRKFAPVMGETNGTFSMQKPAVILTKSTRESLLDSKIMSIIYKRSEGLSYLNKNKACTTDNTVLSEEQNCRLAYQINRDFDTLCRQFLGEFNTVSTRQKVEKVLNAYIEQNIYSQIYSANSIKVKCDDDNNTTDIIAANKLVIDVIAVYNNTIYDVNIYHRAYDLNNAPSE